MLSYNELRNKIEQKGFTLKFFCDKIGMTRQGLEHAIVNETVSAKVLAKMSEVLDIPVSVFFENNPTISISNVSDVKYSAIASTVTGSNFNSVSKESIGYQSIIKTYQEHSEELLKIINKLIEKYE